MSLLDEVRLQQAGVKTGADYLNIEKAPTPIAPAKKVSLLDEIQYSGGEAKLKPKAPVIAKPADTVPNYISAPSQKDLNYFRTSNLLSDVSKVAEQDRAIKRITSGQWYDAVDWNKLPEDLQAKYPKNMSKEKRMVLGAAQKIGVNSDVSLGAQVGLFSLLSGMASGGLQTIKDVLEKPLSFATGVYNFTNPGNNLSLLKNNVPAFNEFLDKADKSAAKKIEPTTVDIGKKIKFIDSVNQTATRNQKGIIDSFASGDAPSIVANATSIIGSLAATIVAPEIAGPMFAISGAGNVSTELENQGIDTPNKEAFVYAMAIPVALLDKFSGQKMASTLEKAFMKKGLSEAESKTGATFLSNVFQKIGKLKDSNFESATEGAQQVVDIISREASGLHVDGKLKQIIEAMLGGKLAAAPLDSISSNRTDDIVRDIVSDEKNRDEIINNPEQNENVLNRANQLELFTDEEINTINEKLPEEKKIVPPESERLPEKINFNRSEKNIARVQNEIKNATKKTRPNIVEKALKSFGYNVRAEKSPSGSRYFYLSNKGAQGGDTIKIRYTDHTLPKHFEKSMGKADFEIDTNSSQDFPFNDIISRMSGKEVTQTPGFKYSDSYAVRKFKQAAKNMTVEDLVAYSSGDENINIQDEANLELSNRGISPDEITRIADTPDFVAKKYTPPTKQTLLEEVQAKEVTGKNKFYNPELFKLQDVYVENFTKRLAQIPEAAGTELPTIAKKIENIGDMLREAYQNKQISNEYIQEKYNAVIQEISQQPDLFKDLPKEAKAYMKQIADKYETLGDLGKDVAGIVNAMWQNSPTVTSKIDDFYNKIIGEQAPPAQTIEETPLPETAPFTEEKTAETTQVLYEERNSEKLIEKHKEGGMFVVKMDNKVEGFTDSRIIKMSPEEYAATKLPSLKEGEIAYKVYTPFTETVEKGSIILKPGVKGGKGNFGRGLIQSIVGGIYGDSLSSFVTMSQKTTVPLLKFLGVKNVLGLLIDTKTGYSGLQLEGVESNKKVTNRIWFRDKFGITKLQEELFAKEKEFAEAWKALSPKIEGIIANNDTVNSLTGQTVVAEKLPDGFKTWNEYIEFLQNTPGNEEAVTRINNYLERVKNWTGSIKAKVIAENRYNGLSEFSPSKRETLKKYQAISHMYFYYPEAMRKILSPEIIELLRKNLDYSKTQISEATDFGGRVLVQKGNLREEDLSGARRKFTTVEEINEQNPVIPSDELAYERYMVNVNDVRNAISEEIDERFDSPEHYIDYLKVIRNAGATQTDLGADIDQEIKRLEDSILRSKKGDQLDFYRTKAPLAQIIDYSGHLANTVYQDNMMTVFSALEKELPGNLKTKRTFYGTAVGVLQDAFGADIRRRDLTDRQTDIMLYGKSKTSILDATKASFINKAGALAAFGFSGIDNIVQAGVVVAMLFPHPKAHATKFEGRSEFEKFFIENGIGNMRATEDGVLNNTLARVREQTIKNKTFDDTVASQDKSGNIKLYNAGNIFLQYASIQPLVLFGNTLESYTSRSSAMYFMTEQVQEASGKKLINGLSIDSKEVLKAFKELTPSQQQTITEETDKRIQRNFSNTNTRSSFGFMRGTEFNVLRGWTTKFLSAHLLRTIDARSLMANKTSKALRELYSDPEVKAMNKQYGDSAKLIGQYAIGVLSLQALVAGALYAISALDDEEDKDESFLTSWLIARKWVFSGILDLDGMLIRQVASPISTSFGFTYELSSSLLDWVQSSIEDNKFAKDDARRRFVKAFGGIGQLGNYAKDADDTIANWSTFGNLNYVQKNTPGHFALNELLPGNYEFAKANAIEFQLKNAKDNGLEFMLDMFGDMVSMRMFQAQMGFQQMFGPLAKTATGKKAEAFKKASVWDNYNTYIKNHGDEGTLNELTLQFFNAYPLEYLGKNDIKVMNNITDYAKARSNESAKMAKAWGDMGFLRQRGFSYSRGESATTTLNKIRETPELAAAFYERIYGLTTKTSDELELKKYLESSLSTPNARSSTWSGLGLVEENNRYENRLKRNMNTFFYDPEASEGNKWYDNVVEFVEDPTSIGKQKTTGKTISSSKAMLDSMEAMLGFASSNIMVEKTVLESIQSVIAKNGKQRVYSLFEQGLANPDDYKHTMKAWMQLQDDSTASYSEVVKDAKYDYEVYGQVGKKPIKEEVKIPTSYDEGDVIKSPYYSVVQVNKKGNIVIKDILGRSFVFSNVDTDKKVGDVLEPGTKIGVAKKGTETNRFNKMGEAEILRNDMAGILQPNAIYSPSYLKTLSIDPIDFYALSRNIAKKGTKKKTSTKKPKSILQEVMDLQPKSNLSLMEQLIQKNQK